MCAHGADCVRAQRGFSVLTDSSGHNVPTTNGILEHIFLGTNVSENTVFSLQFEAIPSSGFHYHYCFRCTQQSN